MRWYWVLNVIRTRAGRGGREKNGKKREDLCLFAKVHDFGGFLFRFFIFCNSVDICVYCSRLALCVYSEKLHVI